MGLTTEYPGIFFHKNFVKIHDNKSCQELQGTIFCNYYTKIARRHTIIINIIIDESFNYISDHFDYNIYY